MDLSEIQAAIGGPNGPISQPEGGEVVPLNTGGLDKTAAEPFPAQVSAAQGAGAAGTSLTPHANQVADGSVNIGGKAPDSSGGPQLLPVVPGLGALTAGGNFGANRPSGGDTLPGEAPAGPVIGVDPTGQGINPMLKPARAPRQDGPFGKPSTK